MTEKCREHPKYKAVRHPVHTRTHPGGCGVCWRIFDAKVRGGDHARTKQEPRTVLVFDESATYYGSHTGRHIGERLAAVIEEIATEGEIDARPRVRVTVEVLP